MKKSGPPDPTPRQTAAADTHDAHTPRLDTANPSPQIRPLAGPVPIRHATPDQLKPPDAPDFERLWGATPRKAPPRSESYPPLQDRTLTP